MTNEFVFRPVIQEYRENQQSRCPIFRKNDLEKSVCFVHQGVCKISLIRLLLRSRNLKIAMQAALDKSQLLFERLM